MKNEFELFPAQWIEAAAKTKQLKNYKQTRIIFLKVKLKIEIKDEKKIFEERSISNVSSSYFSSR